MTTIVTSQEVTDKLASEIGILTVNNLMQTMQIDKLEARISRDADLIHRLHTTIGDLEARINIIADRYPTKEVERRAKPSNRRK